MNTSLKFFKFYISSILIFLIINSSLFASERSKIIGYESRFIGVNKELNIKLIKFEKKFQQFDFRKISSRLVSILAVQKYKKFSTNQEIARTKAKEKCEYELGGLFEKCLWFYTRTYYSDGTYDQVSPTKFGNQYKLKSKVSFAHLAKTNKDDLGISETKINKAYSDLNKYLLNPKKKDVKKLSSQKNFTKLNTKDKKKDSRTIRKIAKQKSERSNILNVRKKNYSLTNDPKPLTEKKISPWEQSVIAAQREEVGFKCKINVDKNLFKLLKNKETTYEKIKQPLNFCIKKSDILKLGKFKDLEKYPKGFIKNAKCSKHHCIREKSGQKVYNYFVQRGPQYHARYPGAMIQGMTWFEIFYLKRLKEEEKTIKRYITNNYGQSNENIQMPKFLSNHLKLLDEKKIYSLIKTNNGRIKMREALGFTLYDETSKVIESQWSLGEFLNKDKLKVKKNNIDPATFKRKELVLKYKSVLSKYRKKLEEEKMSRGKNEKL